MKILLFALAITICLANPTLRNLQSNESDSDVALSTGMTKALHAKVTHGSLPDSDWQILKISNLTKTNTTDGIVYNAIVDVTNNHDTELIANVSVLYQAEENRVEISAFNYQLIHNNETANETTVSNNSSSEPGATNTTEANPSNSTSTNSTNTTLPSNNTSADGYTQLDPSFVTNNGVAYGAVVYGVNAVVQNGINSTKIPNTSYTVTQVTSVSIKNITQGADYQVSASLVNADFVRMNVRCTVFYNKKTGSYKLLSYWYHAFNISDTVSTQPTNTTAPTNSTSNSTSTSPANTTANNTTSEGYTILDVTQVQQSTAIQAALQSGISQLVQVGASQNKFPNTPYTVSELVSASYKNLAKSVSYKFFVKLVNVKYARIEANLTVNYNLVNGSYKLNGYNFRSSNYSIKDLPGNSSTSVNTGSNTGNSTGGNTNSTSSTSTNTNSSGTTNSTGGSTINTNTSSSSTNTTINNTNSDGFTKIDVTQIAQNNQIQGALSFGVAALLQSGVNRNKIPNTPFNLASIGGASYKNQSNGVNYKFSASLVSAKYAHVDANFIVFYRYSNQSYSIGNFSYSSYNYSNSDLLNATSNSGNNSNTASNSTRPANTTVTANSTNNASPANGTSSVNNTAGNSTYADGYVSLNVAQVLQNSTLTGFINQGAAWVIQKGVNDTKIPNTPFNLVQVNSFDERDTPKGDYYHVNAVMKNANNVTVTMKFIQYYKFPTQANANGTLSVQSWTYSVATPRARN